MARSGSMTYDPKTGEWKSSGGGGSSSSSSGSNNKSNSGSSKSSGSSGDNLSASTSNSNSSTGEAEKKYNYIEYNVLEGTLSYIATKGTIKLTAGDTVEIKGIGKYLSGRYFVQDVTRNISSDGYSHKATLIKTDFGKSIKSTSTSSIEKKVEERPAPKPTPQPEQRVHILQKGECLWSVAAKYYGSGTQYPKIANANNISPSQYRRLPIGLRLVIP